MSDPQVGDFINIDGIQIATKAPFNQNRKNNKIFTSGRVLEEIDNAITHNAFNYVVDQVTEITYTSPATPTRPSATAVSPDIIFVHVVDQNTSAPIDPYYELLKKVKVDDTPTYAYVCNQVLLSSIVLDPRDQYQDIYTLYSNTNDYPPPAENEPVPHHYQNWVKTDRFNEELQINLKHTPISLTTKGDVQIDGDSKLTIKELADYHNPADTTTYTEISKTDLILTKTTTTNSINETNAISITSDEQESSVSTNNAVLSVSYTNTDTLSSDTYTDSVIISSHDNSVDVSNPGASIVLTGEHSYIETPILRLKIVD